MRISKLITFLKEKQKEHGDLRVILHVEEEWGAEYIRELSKWTIDNIEEIQFEPDEEGCGCKIYKEKALVIKA